MSSAKVKIVFSERLGKWKIKQCTAPWESAAAVFPRDRMSLLAAPWRESSRGRLMLWVWELRASWGPEAVPWDSRQIPEPRSYDHVQKRPGRRPRGELLPWAAPVNLRNLVELALFIGIIQAITPSLRSLCPRALLTGCRGAGELCQLELEPPDLN